jgi:hypothetical protein
MKVTKLKGGQSAYIELNGWTYYIDDSCNEQFIDKWDHPITTTIEHQPDIPTHPHQVYQDEGWINWADFLGVNNEYV